MPRRSTRQLLKDRFDQSAKLLDRASDQLAQAQRMYFEAGEKRGLEIEPIMGAIDEIRKAVVRFRYDRV